MMITVFEPQEARQLPAEELPAVLTKGEHPVWVDMTGPTEEDAQLMQDLFHFHPLAIEDARKQRQRPKVDEYDDHLFIILNPVATQKRGPTFRELDVFVGSSYLVTVHPDLDPVIQEAERRIGHAGPVTPITVGYLLYVLVDVVVDGYFPVLDGLAEEINGLEDTVLTRSNHDVLNRLFRLRRDLVEVLRVVGPQRDMFNTLTRRDIAFLNYDMLQYYLRDVYDHLLRISDMVNTLHDVLTGMADLHLSMVSNRLNQVVNRLTVFTVIIGMLSAISGFYGMNFEHTWPPFTFPWGVPFTLALMASAVGAIVLFFRHRGWV